MALQTRPSPSWNVSPYICIILGFLHNPPPGSPDIFTIHLHHLGMSPRTSAPSRISPQSTSTVSGYLYSPPPFSSDFFSAVSTIYLPGPYRGTDINIAWHKIQQCARAIHLAVDTLPQILVGMVPRAGTLILAAPGSRGTAMHACSGILTVR